MATAFSAGQKQIGAGDDASSPARGAHVSLSGISKRFGDRVVIRDLDLEIEAGEFVAIVGRSGCGKSTLLRMIAGIESATAGTVAVEGRTSRSSGSSATRLMFQDARLLPWKSVIANVALGLPPGEATKQTALRCLNQVGLADRQNDWPTALSGGQRQRVALARALAAEPRLLLLDEPLGALDALTRREMQELITRLWIEQGFTAILITHDPEEAIALADRVLLLDHGRVSQEIRTGLPRPRPRGTADFAQLSERLLTSIIGPTDDGGER